MPEGFVIQRQIFVGKRGEWVRAWEVRPDAEGWSFSGFTMLPSDTIWDAFQCVTDWAEKMERVGHA